MKRIKHLALWSMTVLLSIASVQAADEATPPGGNSAHQHSSADKLKGLQGAEFERTFLDQMIQHHQMGIQMAKLAQTRASRSEIKDMASKMVSEQQKEVSQMTKWLSQWHNAEPSKMDMEDPSMQKTMDDIEKLKAAKGEEFDKLFLSIMPTHHADGIKMAKLAQARAEHDQVRQLAGNITKTQLAETEKMEAWKATGR